MSDFPPPPETPPPPPPPPPPGAGQPGLEPIGTWPRFGAKIIDILILLVPIFGITWIIADDARAGTLQSTDGRVVLANIVTTLLTYAYFVYLESTRGQTVGKMALGYKVIGPDGGLPSMEAAAKRNAYLLLGLVPYLGGLVQFVLLIVIAVTINSDSFKRGWHDNFAGGTAVVRAA